MSEGADQNQDTAERLQGELDELLRQHEQYTLALDAAMDPRTSLRLQRTLERLDDEIEGLQEALKAYEENPESVRDAAPEEADAATGSGQAVLPEWDEEDEEPATSIYDGVGHPYAGVAGQEPADGSEEDPPTVSLSARPASGPSPAAEPSPSEIAHYGFFDYLVVNDDLVRAQDVLRAIALAELNRRPRHARAAERLIRGD